MENRKTVNDSPLTLCRIDRETDNVLASDDQVSEYIETLRLLGVLIPVKPDYRLDLDIQDLGDLLTELLSYVPTYFRGKWDLPAQVEAWRVALGLEADNDRT